MAVIGGGPAGLATAKHLLERGFEPLVLERADDLGGHWNRRSPHSAAWRGMRATTSKTTTAFSDLPPAREMPMFPTPDQVQGYLREYASRFGVAERLLTGARVTAVCRSGSHWTVRWNEGSAATERRFDAVVVAGGRFAVPRLPADLMATDADPGPLFMHSRDYRTRDEFRGLRVLVYGNGTSGLEIACDLASEDSVEVVSACARPRFVLPKISRGIPCEWAWWSDYAGLQARALDRPRLAAELRAAALELTGDPCRCGAPAPDPDVAATGVTHCQGYLPLVAEGRIEAKAAVRRLAGGVAHFADGSRGRFDAIIAATGYEPSFPFLPPDLRPPTTPPADAALRRRTLHPTLPSLAFVGQFRMRGPYLPVLELQARWLAAHWAGEVDLPAPGRTEARTVDCYHELTAELAGALGAVPRPAARPELAAALLFGPPAPARWRLDGPGSRPEAEEDLLAAVGEFGPMPSPDADAIARLRSLADAVGEPQLAEAAAAIQSALGRR